jgi:hypothetical protein
MKVGVVARRHDLRFGVNAAVGDVAGARRAVLGAEAVTGSAASKSPAASDSVPRTTISSIPDGGAAGALASAGGHGGRAGGAAGPAGSPA